jgi:hypothetical protein
LICLTPARLKDYSRFFASISRLSLVTDLRFFCAKSVATFRQPAIVAHKQQGLSRRATNPLRERLWILRTWLSYLHVRAPVFLLDHMHLVF